MEDIEEIETFLKVVAADRCNEIIKSVYCAANGQEKIDIQNQIYIYAFKDGMKYMKKTRRLS